MVFSSLKYYELSLSLCFYRSEKRLPLNERASGALLHITCLPSKFGIGDLGPYSRKFIDLLSDINQHFWNILPLTPTSLKYGNSPYQPDSAFAGNTLLISPELIVEEGYLKKEYVTEAEISCHGRVDFVAASQSKKKIIEGAFQTFIKDKIHAEEFEDFCRENSEWLEDYALYKALVASSGRPWFSWPNQLRDRNTKALMEKRETLKLDLECERFAQFLFFEQWKKIKIYAQKKKVQIIGDMSFYLSYESADAWAYPEIFKLNAGKKPSVVAGVPPDYFSKDGQLWCNPVYKWSSHNCILDWWIKRITQSLKLVDMLRLDHFRGFIASWQVSASDKTAKNGHWVRGASHEFFALLANRFTNLPFIAEDLGTITPKVEETMTDLKLPRMKVLLFAFDGSKNNPYLPKNYDKNSVVFTGTHDTNTARGWFTEEATPKQKNNLFNLIGKHAQEEDVHWELIELAQNSIANLSIIPAQDILGLGSEARMNNPAATSNNWNWQLTSEQIVSENFQKFGEISDDSKR